MCCRFKEEIASRCAGGSARAGRAAERQRAATPAVGIAEDGYRLVINTTNEHGDRPCSIGISTPDRWPTDVLPPGLDGRRASLHFSHPSLQRLRDVVSGGG